MVLLFLLYHNFSIVIFLFRITESKMRATMAHSKTIKPPIRIVGINIARRLTVSLLGFELTSPTTVVTGAILAVVM